MKLDRLMMVLVCLLPAACGDKPAGDGTNTPATQNQAQWTWIQSNSGAFWAAWRPVQGPVEMGPSFPIEIRLAADKEGSPLDLPTAQINIGARMPEHQHGMLQTVEVERLSAGHYRVEGMRFHMLGYWQLHVDVNRPPIAERAQFDIQL